MNIALEFHRVGEAVTNAEWEICAAEFAAKIKAEGIVPFSTRWHILMPFGCTSNQIKSEVEKVGGRYNPDSGKFDF